MNPNKISVPSGPFASGCEQYPAAVKCCMDPPTTTTTRSPTPFPTPVPPLTPNPTPFPPATPAPTPPPTPPRTPSPPGATPAPTPSPTPMPSATTATRADCNNGGVRCQVGQACIKVTDFYVCQFQATPAPPCTDTSCASGFQCVDMGAGKMCSEIPATKASPSSSDANGPNPDWLTTPILASIVAGGVCFLLLVIGCIIAICCLWCSPNATKSARYSYEPGGDSGSSIAMAEGVVAGTMTSWPGGSTGTGQMLGSYSQEQGGYGSNMNDNDSPAPYSGATGFVPGAVPNSASYSVNDKPTF